MDELTVKRVDIYTVKNVVSIQYSDDGKSVLSYFSSRNVVYNGYKFVVSGNFTVTEYLTRDLDPRYIRKDKISHISTTVNKLKDKSVLDQSSPVSNNLVLNAVGYEVSGIVAMGNSTRMSGGSLGRSLVSWPDIPGISQCASELRGLINSGPKNNNQALVNQALSGGLTIAEIPTGGTLFVVHGVVVLLVDQLNHQEFKKQLLYGLENLERYATEQGQKPQIGKAIYKIK